MLERQLAPPDSTQAPSPRQDVLYSRPPLSRVSSILPPSVDIGASSPLGADAMAQRAARGRPAAARKDKKKPPRTVQSVAIDLKAELRTESEKAALKGAVIAKPTTSGANITPSEGVTIEKSTAAAPAYSAPKVAKPLASTKKASVVGASAESDETSAGSSGGGTRLEEVAAGARAAQQELDLRRVSNKMQGIAGQVTYFSWRGDPTEVCRSLWTWVNGKARSLRSFYVVFYVV